MYLRVTTVTLTQGVTLWHFSIYKSEVGKGTKLPIRFQKGVWDVSQMIWLVCFWDVAQRFGILNEWEYISIKIVWLRQWIRSNELTKLPDLGFIIINDCFNIFNILKTFFSKFDILVVKYLCILNYSLEFSALCGIQFLFIWRWPCVGGTNVFFHLRYAESFASVERFLSLKEFLI